MIELMANLKIRIISLLRSSEKYTKTDMVYLVKTGFWVNLNFIITSVLAVLLSVAFANFLSPETYGTYQYLLSLSALASALMLGGMTNAVTQAVARGYEGALRTSVRAQLQWAVVPGILSIAGAIYYFLHSNNEIGIGLVCIAFLTPLVNTFSTYAAFLNGKKEFKKGFQFNLIITITYYVSIFIAIIFLKNAPLLLLVNIGVNTIATAYVYWKTLKSYRPNDSVDPETIPYGKHLSVINAFGTILTQLDSILVFHFLGPINLAVYSFATMIPEKASGFFNFIGVASLPKFSNQTHASIKENILPKLARVAVFASLATIAYILCAPYLFHLLFPRYMNTVWYTQVYAVIIVLLAVLNMITTALIAKQLKRELYIVGLLNPLLLVFLQIPLLLSYGILGMLFARILTDSIAIVVTLFLFFRATGHESPQSL